MSYPAQSDSRTCGIAACAAFIARNGGSTAQNFRHYQNATTDQVHRFQTDLHRVASRTGFPWPRALGTAPWALQALAAQVTGHPFAVKIWNEAVAQEAQNVWESGQDAFIYTGERLIPRHVVLILGKGSVDAAHRHVTIFEPATGSLFQISPDELASQQWSGHAGKPHWGWWSRPLLAVLPAAT